MRKPRTDGASRRAAKAVVKVEPLEGRRLLSHALAHPATAAPRASANVQVEAADAPPRTPIGHATNHRPHFYRIYRGPRRPELLAVSTTGEVVGTNLILTAAVGGPIVTNPASADQEAIYTFAVDRGGATDPGPLPTRANKGVRFDTAIVVAIKQAGGTTAVVRYPDTVNPLTTVVTRLKPSAVAIAGDALKITVPLSALPSSGKAINQWRGAFFTRVPRPSGARGVASLVPMFDDYPIGYRPK